MPVVEKIENTIVQGHYIKKLATVLSVNEQIIEDGIKKITTQQTRGFGAKKDSFIAKTDPSSRREKLELYVLALLLQEKTAERFEELKEALRTQDFSAPSVAQIVIHLESFLKLHQ